MSEAAFPRERESSASRFPVHGALYRFAPKTSSRDADWGVFAKDGAAAGCFRCEAVEGPAPVGALPSPCLHEPIHFE